MVCVNVCFISCVITITFISIMLVNKNAKVYTDFMNLLSREKKMKIEKITQERLNITYKSSFVSLILSYIIMNGLPPSMSIMSQKCLFIILFVIIVVIMYSIHPKSDYIVNYIDKKEERKAWIDLKKDIKYKKIIGLVVSLFIYAMYDMLV